MIHKAINGQKPLKGPSEKRQQETLVYYLKIDFRVNNANQSYHTNTIMTSGKQSWRVENFDIGLQNGILSSFCVNMTYSQMNPCKVKVHIDDEIYTFHGNRFNKTYELKLIIFALKPLVTLMFFMYLHVGNTICFDFLTQ